MLQIAVRALPVEALSVIGSILSHCRIIDEVAADAGVWGTVNLILSQRLDFYHAAEHLHQTVAML